MNVRKNHAVCSEIRFLTKSLSKPYGRAMAMPPLWELKDISLFFVIFTEKNNFMVKREMTHTQPTHMSYMIYHYKITDKLYTWR